MPRRRSFPISPERLLAALLTAALLTVLVPRAQAQSPFGNLPQGTPAEVPTQTTATSGSSTDAVSTLQAALIVAGAVALIGGIGLVIMRDARRRAPVTAGDSEAPHLASDAHRRARSAKQKQRAKARSARAQRRRNR